MCGTNDAWWRNTPVHSVYTDWNGQTVKLHVSTYRHLVKRHEAMLKLGLISAIGETISEPDKVFRSSEEDESILMFRADTAASYSPPLLTKVVCAYPVSDSYGYVVTAYPVKKEGGDIGEQLYKKQ